MSRISHVVSVLVCSSWSCALRLCSFHSITTTTFQSTTLPAYRENKRHMLHIFSHHQQDLEQEHCSKLYIEHEFMLSTLYSSRRREGRTIPLIHQSLADKVPDTMQQRQLLTFTVTIGFIYAHKACHTRLDVLLKLLYIFQKNYWCEVQFGILLNFLRLYWANQH